MSNNNNVRPPPDAFYNYAPFTELTSHVHISTSDYVSFNIIFDRAYISHIFSRHCACGLGEVKKSLVKFYLNTIFVLA